MNPYRVPSLQALSWLDHGFGTRASAGWLAGEPIAALRQIHSAIVRVANRPAALLDEGDALITREPGLWLAVRTADCVPVILADPDHRAVAIIHAGWRGCCQAIVGNTVQALIREYSSSPERLHAALGPAIGECCFEVGPEVATRFRPWLPERRDLNRRAHIDLSRIICRQLVAAGLSPSRIARHAPCTRCDPRFHSYRREGERAGRMVSAVSIRTAL